MLRGRELPAEFSESQLEQLTRQLFGYDESRITVLLDLMERCYRSGRNEIATKIQKARLKILSSEHELEQLLK